MFFHELQIIFLGAGYALKWSLIDQKFKNVVLLLLKAIVWNSMMVLPTENDPLFLVNENLKS